jgi:hypothetical protein
MVRMHCKSLILQHPLTKCHIINSREMQKIKMNTDTTNQNKYNTKNTLTSRPNRLKKKKANPADRCRPWVWPDPVRPWVRRARRPIGLGLAGRDCNIPIFLFFYLVNKFECYAKIISHSGKITNFQYKTIPLKYFSLYKIPTTMPNMAFK